MATFNLQHLKYFYDTMRLGGVSHAARENHVSQSAVSQGIAKLEISFGKALLIHRKNRIQLTEDGHTVFAEAASVLKSAERLEQLISHPTEEYSGQVTVACTHSLAQSLLVGLCHRLNQEAPKATLKLRFGHVALVKQWLKEGSVDFGIVLDNEDLSAFETELLYQGHFELFRDKDHTLPNTLTEAVFTEPRTEVNILKKAYRERYGRELKTIMEISSWDMIYTLLRGSSLVGFIPDYLLLHPERRGNLKVCDYKLPRIPYQLLLVKERLIPLSRAASLFFKMIKEGLLLSGI
ncbi:LysR family transcriptional regulator [Estrella lausannensis]|uniref:Transcriptional regulator, LysR family n=1 Tax=Estrella lausannensis TaxID=483423 RepID=A0A0H5DNK4_9BACT|nr:LysR family transcriptional regulator [Estrella lausannensis]CRX37931.1 Transcriptional regulator, LysR family [Estrella lausannensis]